MKINANKEVSFDKLKQLLCYKAETESLDFKEVRDMATTKSIVELAKDILAMTNTCGGHIVFGVEDKTWRIVGVAEEVVKFFSESKTVNDQLRKYCGAFVSVHSATHEITDDDGNRFRLAVIFVPQYREGQVPAQHDGSYPDARNPGKQEHAFRKGDVYVRKSDQSKKVEVPSDIRLIRLAPPPQIDNALAEECNAGFPNPYDIAGAATAEMFKGRDQEINKLLAYIENGTHTAVHGLQRMGKTSFVKEVLVDRINSHPRLKGKIIFAEVDLQKLGRNLNYKDVFYSITTAIGLGASSSSSGAKEIEYAIENFLAESKHYQKGRPADILREYEKTLERIAKAVNKKIVLFLDEFSELYCAIEENKKKPAQQVELEAPKHPHELRADVSLMRWFSSLLKNSSLSGKIVFVFAVRPFVPECEDINSVQVLKLLPPISLYHLDAKSANALITDPLNGKVAFEDKAVDYLFRQTNGHPYLIQFMLQDIVNTLKIEGRSQIKLADIKKLEGTMIGEGPEYAAQFKVLDLDYCVEEAMMSSRYHWGRGVLALIAKYGSESKEGWVQFNIIQRALNARSYSNEQIDTVLSQLFGAKIIQEANVNNDLCYRVTVPLLRKRYVKQNMYQKYFV